MRVHHQWSSVLIVKPQRVAWKFSDPACRRYLVNCALSSPSTARATERDDRMDCCFCSPAAGDCNLCWEALIELFEQIKVTLQSWHVTCAAQKKKKKKKSIAVCCTNVTTYRIHLSWVRPSFLFYIHDICGFPLCKLMSDLLNVERCLQKSEKGQVEGFRTDGWAYKQNDNQQNLKGGKFSHYLLAAVPIKCQVKFHSQ